MKMKKKEKKDLFQKILDSTWWEAAAAAVASEQKPRL